MAGTLPGWAQSKFDHYVLALSWSPEYCHSHPTSQQCTGEQHFGFVVHGLWPEYDTGGGGPEHCGSQPGLSDPSKMLDIMPDLNLIGHEWSTHGTCTGLTAEQYFGLIRSAFSSIKLPPQFAAATSQVTVTPLQVKQAFEQSNPTWQNADIMISCTSNYLQAVEICLTKALKPMPCPAPHDCRAKSIHIPPVR
jgi:ribonuclease T2